jgi:hypothetical protein
MDYVLAQNDMSLTHRAMELILLKEYAQNGINGEVTVVRPRLLELTGVSTNTYRAFAQALVASGRWEVRAGVGLLKTKYKPVFLDAFTSTGKGNQ